MFHRLFIVVYVLLHIPLLYTFGILLNADWDGISTYQARCISNGELVVLQGVTDNSPNTFDESYLSSVGAFDKKGELRFYCAYRDEIKYHIEAYAQAVRGDGDVVQANQNYFAFKENARATYSKNYELEVISTSHQSLWYDMVEFLISFVFVFICLQILRMIYQYIVFGRFNWHPYKNIDTK